MWFYNSSTEPKESDYKALYSLLKPDDPLENFDLSTLTPNILTTMTIAALSKVKLDKFAKAMNIVSERYVNLVNKATQEAPPQTQNDDLTIVKEVITVPGSDDEKLKAKKTSNDSDNDEEDDYDPMAGFSEKASYDALNGPDSVNGSEDDSQIEDYTLPIPKDMTLDDKKEHLKQIVVNFIKLSTVAKNGAAGASLDGDEKTLSRIAITKWSKDSWVLILARLATRGLSATPELANLVREELLKFLQVDIKSKIDLSSLHINHPQLCH
ncbi:unnamed protein product [Ambrosiozyma monospora]|uniref:Unnamed protein product n=1 Tax=Ambrosiozyma monospora TaxID=43982 RepID=A0ACB5TX58_AMBMO|nr:unnamed protein product [Ambrosiozyma monospora]